MKTVCQIRRDFPALAQIVHGKPLAYLDNAATSQKPQQVIDAVSHFYSHDNANVHRGIHALSERATAQFEAARQNVANFINAESDNIVFARGTTDSINLVAAGFAQDILKPGDEILVSEMEHHSNIVPWQLAAARTGAKVIAAPVCDDGSLDMAAFATLLSPRTKIVAIVHVSNALGTVNPVADIVELAHAAGAAVLIDGAQAVAHGPVDVQALGCDFYAFSGHKMLGPTGIGVLYGKPEWLDRLPPYQGGGDMIRSVSFAGTTFAEPPSKFEAGTPHIAGAVGLGAAIDYIRTVGFDRIATNEKELLDYGSDMLQSIPGLRLVGTAPKKSAVLSFVVAGAHPHDIGTILDREGIAIRAGHHCTQPLMTRFGIPATARASLMFYNTTEELDRLGQALGKTIRLLAA